MLVLCSLCLFVRTWSRGRSPQTTEPLNNELEHQFIADLNAAPAGKRAVVVDVGANNGQWSRKWCSMQQNMTRHGKQLDVLMLEPQPHFRKLLDKQAAECNATFLAAAASTTDGRTGFRISKQSTKARISEAVHDPDADQIIQVPTIDLAAFLQTHLEPNGVSLVKLDVEGHEFDLLPWLLTRGALCAPRYVMLEWHLNFVPPDRRLAALGLRLSFHTTLQQGCRTPPAGIHHDDFGLNNVALPIPGLSRLALEHSSWAGNSRGGTHILRSTAELELADFDYFDTVRGSLPSARCRAPPSCHGGCVYEGLACDREQTETAYLHMVKNKRPVRRAGLLPKAGLVMRANWSVDACRCEAYPAVPQHATLSLRRDRSPSRVRGR